MGIENRLYSQDLPVLAVGAGLEAAVIAGGIAIAESGQNIMLKVTELGAAGVIGAFGVAAIATGIQGITDRRHHTTHPQQ